jgi:serine/threonine protein phosphatase PrpC
MRPTKNQARPPVPGDLRANPPEAPPSIERPDRGATGPGHSASPEKADEVSSRASWRDRVRDFWRGLTGSTGPRGPSPTVDLVPESAASSPEGQARLLRVGVVSTVGNYREHNEDNFSLPTLAGKSMGGGVGHRDACMDISIEEGSIYPFVVADGMGGQLAGEKASQMAVDIIPKELSRRIGSAESDDRQIQRVIKDAVAAANQEILGLSVIQTEFNNMGTTVVLALFRNGRVYVAGIGDSRAYRFRDGRIEQLTKDHSLAQALLEAGTITAEELPNHKFNHVLYLYLGSKDARGGPEDVKAAEFRAGDRFLLASDGLTGVVHDAQLAEVVAGFEDPQVSARALIKLALDNNSKDNVTCLVVHAV